MQAILLSDQNSNGKGNITYAKKGDKVTIIIKNKVCIVEFKGNRFATQLTNLKIL